MINIQDGTVPLCIMSQSTSIIECVGIIEVCVVPDDNVSVEFDSACCDAITSAHVAETSESPLSRNYLVDVIKTSQSTLSAEELQQLVNLLATYSDVIAAHDDDLGCTIFVKHTIDTATSKPIRQRPYRVPFRKRYTIAQHIKKMEEQGIVRPSTTPSWASPVVLESKKDGTDPFCVDYRKLNAITKKDEYPLPRNDDILNTLRTAQFLMDLASGYILADCLE